VEGNVIVIVYPQFYGIGGIARYLDSFLSNLPHDASDITLITGDELDPGRAYSRVKLVHISMPRGRLGLLWWSLKARRCIDALARQATVSAVNLHVPPLIPGLALSRRIPIVLTAHTTYLGMSGSVGGQAQFMSLRDRLALWLKIKMEHIIISRASMVISLTEMGRDELALYGRRDHVAVVPNGVDLAQFAVKGDDIKDIDVLFCGRIERRKGSRPMVDVCLELIANRPLIRIVIVGYGDDEAYVRQALVGFPDNVVMTGRVPFSEVVSYYRRSKVYASTSYYEGLPGTCLEAMAVGLPVVVWNLQFYRGLVSANVTGLFVETDNHHLMATRILQLLDEPGRASELGQRARLHVRDRYDWRMLARRLSSVHRELAQQGSAPLEVLS
jgi:glycosyltransferase involved in cell wall biosynthesis